MKEVTVIIPNYNGIKFLKECLEAVLHQDENTPEYQVLVVDNGSKDGSLELMRLRFPQVNMIALPENTGFCHAVNVGIRAADTPYVLLLNNDTKVDFYFIKALYKAIEDRPRVFSVSGKMLMWDRPELVDDAGDRYCVLGWAYARGKGRPAQNYEKPSEIFSACGGAAIYRKSIFDQIGLFDEAHFAYLEDLDIGYRARLWGYRNYYEPSAKVIHYGSATSGSRYNEWKTSLAAANSVYVILKNMPFWQILWNMPFLFLGFFLKFLFFCKKGMGMIYMKGLRDGFQKSAANSRSFKKRKRDWKNCLAVQWQLYVNVFRILKKY
ncbi:MAG: glycosyltransferase family 2 protein [Lachnospiraceae bacterium]|nr:glycosyltransferase family 2 protein [Lachnospiraceae bacterium]